MRQVEIRTHKKGIMKANLIGIVVLVCLAKPGPLPAADATGTPKLVPLEAFTVNRNTGESRTFSSFDRPDAAAGGVMLEQGALRLEDVELSQVLDIYQKLSGRTVIRSPLPNPRITLVNQTPLARHEALQALDTILAQNGVTMILIGTKFVKAVPAGQAPTEPAPVIELPADQLPDSSSYMVYVVELTSRKPNDIVPALQPFAKMPNSIVTIPDGGLLILRDYSANVRRMLQIIDQLEGRAGLLRGK